MPTPRGPAFIVLVPPTMSSDKKVYSDSSPMNIATISAGFEKGDFLVREEQGNRVYFDFFEEVRTVAADEGIRSAAVLAGALACEEGPSAVFLISDLALLSFTGVQLHFQQGICPNVAGR